MKPEFIFVQSLNLPIQMYCQDSRVQRTREKKNMKSIRHITGCLAGTSECKQVHHQQTARIPEYKNTPTYLGYSPYLHGVSIPNRRMYNVLTQLVIFKW